MKESNYNIDINKLLLTIRNLMKVTPGQWVSWRKISKLHEGSEEYAELLSGIAELPEYRKYFSFYKNKVILNEVGLHKIVEQKDKISDSEISINEKIADAVISYASSLKNLKIHVEDISTIGQTEKRFVHSVHINPIDDIIPSETPVNLCPTDWGAPVHGRIIGQDPDGSCLYVAFELQVYKSSMPALLTVDRGFLLRQLASQIRNSNNISPIYNGCSLCPWVEKLCNSL